MTYLRVIFNSFLSIGEIIIFFFFFLCDEFLICFKIVCLNIILNFYKFKQYFSHFTYFMSKASLQALSKCGFLPAVVAVVFYVKNIVFMVKDSLKIHHWLHISPKNFACFMMKDSLKIHHKISNIFYFFFYFCLLENCHIWP